MPGKAKTGVPTLVKISTLLCKALSKFGPHLYRWYPDSTALHVAIAAAQVACAELERELEKVREYGD
jgi:hypothetical protein